MSAYDTGTGEQDSWRDGPVKMPPVVTPRLVQRRRRRSVPRPSTGVIVGLAAVAAMVIVGGIGFALLRPDGPVAPDAAPASTSTTADAAAAAALQKVLPRGYSDQNCRPAAMPAGATAALACDATTSTGGGAVSPTFALIPDQDKLGTALSGVSAGGGVVLCPGRIQSPGPWRRGGLTQPVRGTLVCATPPDGPVLAWTDTDKHLLTTVRGAALEQLYTWWVAHA